MAERERLLVTGATGRVGTALCRELGGRYDLRMLSHSRVPEEVGPRDEVVVGDVASYATMVEVAAGVDGIMHLALGRMRREMTQAERARQTFDVDMMGTYCVFEAARVNRVPTVIYASTNHVTGINEKRGIRSGPEMTVRPDSIYGAGKAFGEALGRSYVDLHGLRVFCIRIANFNGLDEPGRRYESGYSRWLSPRDLAQLVWRCMEARELDWGIFYGVSKGGEQKWDISNARRLLGYEPEDDGSLEEWRSRYRE